MKDRKLDLVTNDIAVENYDGVIIDGLEQIAQNVAIRLRMFQGEWFRDTRLGLPYYSDSFTKADQTTVDTYIKTVIKDTPGINEIISFESNYDSANRSYSVSFKANTIYGVATLNNLNLG